MSAAENAKPDAGRRRVPELVGTGQGINDVKHSPENSAALLLALASLDAAREQLDRFAMATDEPPWTVVNAADNVDAARAHLSEAIAGGFRHDLP